MKRRNFLKLFGLGAAGVAVGSKAEVLPAATGESLADLADKEEPVSVALNGAGFCFYCGREAGYVRVQTLSDTKREFDRPHRFLAKRETVTIRDTERTEAICGICRDRLHLGLLGSGGSPKLIE